MTSSELEAFRKTVRETLESANKEHDQDVMYRFSKEALAEAFPQHQVRLRCRWRAEHTIGDRHTALPSRPSTCCRADLHPTPYTLNPSPCSGAALCGRVVPAVRQQRGAVLAGAAVPVGRVRGAVQRAL